MFYDNFCKLCKERNISVKRAATEIGLSNSIGTKWKKNPNLVPNGDTLEKIAKYFGVSISYLLSGDENEKSPASEDTELDSDSIKILELLHQLTPENSVRAIAYIQGLVDTQ